MAEKGSWSCDDTASVELVPANVLRSKVVIQARVVSAGVVALGFGQAAEAGKGVRLMATGSVIAVAGALAPEAIYGICETGSATASGGWQEDLGICSE